jgi:hypothetical protein
MKIEFSPDGRLLTAATWDGDILVFDVRTWQEPKKLVLKAGSPTALTFSPNGAELALSSDIAVFICESKAWTCRKLTWHVGPAHEFIGAGFSQDGTKFAACMHDGVQWWDLATGQTERSWESRGLGFFCTLSPNRTYLVVGGGGIYGKKHVQLLNASSGESLARLSEFRSGLFASAISHSEKWLALGGGSYGSGGDLSLWSLPDFHEVGFVSVGTLPVEGLAFSADDSVLAAASDDGAVFLFSVEGLRGPARTEQKNALCGEVLTEQGRVYIVPLTKVPTPMRRDFNEAWRLEVVEPGAIAALAGRPVILKDWEIESKSDADRAIVNKYAALQSTVADANRFAEYAVFGNVQNPGWNKGYVLKVYASGDFVAASNSGECLAYGTLSTTTTPNFDILKARLLAEGLLAVPRDPLTRGLDHYGTRFIGLFNGVELQLRSDADVVDFSKPKTEPTRKEKEFGRILNQEQAFIDSLVHAGMHSAH